MVKKANAKSADSQTPRDQAINAMLALAAEMPFEMVGLKDIAAEAGLSLSELAGLFEDKAAILSAYGRRLDQRILEGAPNIANDMSPRDLLFDLLMDRFDQINQHRPALLSILGSFKFDPKEALFSLPHLGRSMAWVLEAAGVQTGGYKGALRVLGLTGVYLYALRAWKEDGSEDLAKTMAALDRALERTESWAQNFGL